MTEALTHSGINSLFDRDDRLFDAFALSVEKRFEKAVASGKPLLTVSTKRDLFDVYLDAFPENERQHHNCHCCRQFIQRYGNIVIVDDANNAVPVMWSKHDADRLPDEFSGVSRALYEAVLTGDVDGVFVSNEKRYGTPVTGEWHHFAVTPPQHLIHKDRLVEPHQVVALKKQHFGTLSHGLADFDRDTIIKAINLLDNSVLHRSEKFLAPAKFLLDLQDQLALTKDRRLRNRILWNAVASAPVGFCTPRSGVIGTLLEDIAAGLSLDDVKARFAAKTDPLQYQRAQVPASAGNIKEAEKIVEKLGIANSLKRRFAKFEEVPKIWEPADEKANAPAGGVFGHLAAKGKVKPAPELIGSLQDMTWAKFFSKVLPNAIKIQVLIGGLQRYNFVGVTTAVDMDAPPILKWDKEDARNPLAWYVYHGGSIPSRWNLHLRSTVDVTGIMLKPALIGDDGHFATQYGNNVIFLLKGARDVGRPSLALFPECLRTELHSIRSTIEAFSKAGTPDGAEEGTANGLLVGSAKDCPVIRVTTAIGKADYRIDRWD